MKDWEEQGNQLTMFPNMNILALLPPQIIEYRAALGFPPYFKHNKHIDHKCYTPTLQQAIIMLYKIQN